MPYRAMLGRRHWGKTSALDERTAGSACDIRTLTPRNRQRPIYLPV